jgi:glucose/arabinose dehydrogenase
VSLLLAFSPASAAAAVPPGFEDTVLFTAQRPTALDFTPDGRMVISIQRGEIRVYENGTLLPTPALDLSSKVCSDGERGALGVAVDPDFATTRHVFVYYTLKKSGVCGRPAPADAPVNRVSRFTLGDDNIIDPGSEVVIVDEIPSPALFHNAGGLYFGKDNFLYVAVGDGGCDYTGDSGCAASNNATRDRHVLLGKVLRLTASGGIPPGNPFQGTGTARCNLTGRTTPGTVCRETFAWGLRNPFRLGFDPNVDGTRFFINDVGQEYWEEIDEGQAGADYGWNVREAHCAANSMTNCGPPPAGMTNPIFQYAHSSGCAAITGGAFVPNGLWGPSYDGSYLFGDYVCGKIQALRRAGSGYAASDFATGLGSIVELRFGPWGSSQALYYVVFRAGGPGDVHRVAYTGNRTPTASATANPTSGAAPLAVGFDASASSDPDGDALTYNWSFGDGTPAATTPRVTHTYAVAGTYQATLRVTDSRGGSDTETVRIDVGNTAPTPTIQSPAASTRFRVGQPLTLRGAALDAEDGALPDSSLEWRVLLHHNTHTHPFLGPLTGNGHGFAAPPPEDLRAAATSYLEILLTATDSKGLSRTVSQDLRPNAVPLTFATDPTGLLVKLDGAAVTAPQTVTSWEGYEFEVDVQYVQGGSARGKVRAFMNWSDGGAGRHRITTPATATQYTARFNEAECGGGVGVGALLLFLASATGRWLKRRRLV